jgi:hypothetical protein
LPHPGCFTELKLAVKLKKLPEFLQPGV